MKEGCFGENLGEDKITEVQFEDLKKDILVELTRYIRNHVLEASMRKGTFNVWAVKFPKIHTRDNRCLYHVKDIDRGDRLEIDGRGCKKSLEDKSNIQRTLKLNMSRNEKNV